MADIQRYNPSAGLQAKRLERTVGRELDTLRAGTDIRLAQIEAETEKQIATADAVAFVGRRAMNDVALLSQIETQLATAVPHASGRLAAIADLTAIALSEVVADTTRTVRKAQR